MRKLWVVAGALIICAVVALVVVEARKSTQPADDITAAATQTAPATATPASAAPSAPAASGGVASASAASAGTTSAATSAGDAPAAATTAAQPATTGAAAASTTASQPTAQDSAKVASAQPAATQPTTAQPATTQSATTQPAATQSAAAQPGPALYPDDMYLGSADAKLTIIEYASLSCPHCARFDTEVLPKIKAAYIDKGLVRWVFRDFPLNRAALQAAILTHCGSPLRYFGLVDSLFKSQDYWAAQPDPLAALKQIGVTEGISEKAFDACLADKTLKDKIVDRLQEASKEYKVDSTPSFIIKGKVHAGELPYDDFKKLIDDALGRS